MKFVLLYNNGQPVIDFRGRFSIENDVGGIILPQLNNRLESIGLVGYNWRPFYVASIFTFGLYNRKDRRFTVFP